MSNLRNPEIRSRDIRKLVNCKAQNIVWHHGCDNTSEWVFASLEDDIHIKKLIEWLLSKKIPSNSEIILVKSNWNNPKKMAWSNILSELKKYFGKEEFQIYDIDLKWLLEYKAQEIVRFGKYKEKYA